MHYLPPITISLAGIPMEIHARCPKNLEFFSNYRTDEPPLFAIIPSDKDIADMNAIRKPISNQKDATSDPANRIIIENNAIHKLIAEKLTEYDTLLMHGSALCMDDNGYLFTAPSGTGKSTHARLWRQVFGDRVWMIDDDKPLLQIKESEVIVWGSPWNGKHRLGRNASAPLRAVISLTRDSTNHIEPLETADAFEVIMRQVYCCSSVQLTAD